jgi:tRNA pseudouridine55 synthase
VGAKALKVVELFMHLPKEYEAHVHLGAVSTTYDAEGVIERWRPVPGWSEPDVLVVRSAIAQRFLGTVSQVPPVHSAVKIGGERAYRKARQGRGVAVTPREVEILECDIEKYEYPHLHLRVRCGSGTYIRSLAHDLGQVLRCGGYLEGLRRTWVGEWSVVDAIRPEEASWTKVIPLKEILSSMNRQELNDAEAEDIRCGRSILLTVKPDTIAWHQGLPIAILTPLRDGSGTCRARKVL